MYYYPQIVPGTPDWQRVISASQVASLLGVGYHSRLDLWRASVGIQPPQEVSPALAWGITGEAKAIALLTQLRPDLDIIAHPGGIYLDRALDDTPLGCTPDAWALGAPVEIKCPYSLHEPRATIPLMYEIQVQTQIWVLGTGFAHYVEWGMDNDKAWLALWRVEANMALWMEISAAYNDARAWWGDSTWDTHLLRWPNGAKEKQETLLTAAAASGHKERLL